MPDSLKKHHKLTLKILLQQSLLILDQLRRGAFIPHSGYRGHASRQGGTKGKSTVDHVIVLGEILRRNRNMGRKTYVVYGDAVKCCDKLWLKDCLLEMRSAGCNLQDLQLIYQLNSETEITIVRHTTRKNRKTEDERHC